jgi:hypothetical protein
VYMYNDFLFILRRKGAVMFWCCHGVLCICIMIYFLYYVGRFVWWVKIYLPTRSRQGLEVTHFVDVQL